MAAEWLRPHAVLWNFHTMILTFAYFGPETTLPVATVAATVVGVVMVVAKASMRKIKGVVRLVRDRNRAEA